VGNHAQRGNVVTFNPDQARARAADTAYPDRMYDGAGIWPDPVRIVGSTVDLAIDMSWLDITQAACRDYPSNLFFPETGQKVDPEVKLICSQCPLHDACREHGIRHERFGVWGGLSEADRKKIRRTRRDPSDPGRPLEPIRHGTEWGYTKHSRYPDVYGPPCEACRDANNTAKRWRRMQSLSILYNGDDAA
jgi:WhiB family transcriptional regulator, redox-sensing transcriptional regulator